MYFNLFGRLMRIFPNCNKIDKGHPLTKAAVLTLTALDRVLFSIVPFLAKYSGTIVISGQKNR
jgi:hypothetical protein